MAILIVEDDILISEHLSDILTRNNFEVAGIANNYQSAIDFLKQNAPTMVLLDINLNDEKNGISLAKQLSMSKIPFIYVTAQSDPMTLQEVVKTHPLGFVKKPFKSADVISQLKIALNL